MKPASTEYRTSSGSTVFLSCSAVVLAMAVVIFAASHYEHLLSKERAEKRVLLLKIKEHEESSKTQIPVVIPEIAKHPLLPDTQ